MVGYQWHLHRNLLPVLPVAFFWVQEHQTDFDPGALDFRDKDEGERMKEGERSAL